MIRINLLPSKKRGKGRAAPVDGLEKRGGIYVVSMLVLAASVGLVLYFVLDSVQQETLGLQGKTRKVEAEIARIKELIDEDRLREREATLARLQAAQEKVDSQRRTPVQIMHELANILTPGREPDKIQEEYLKCKSKDPNCALDSSWDGHSIWIKTLDERDGGLIEMSGFARDAADLSEFVKRLRVSARFQDVSHPKFNARREAKDKKNEAQALEFSMTARVTYWD